MIKIFQMAHLSLCITFAVFLSGCAGSSSQNLSQEIPPSSVTTGDSIYPNDGVWGGDVITAIQTGSSPLIGAILHEAGKLALFSVDSAGKLVEVTPPKALNAYHPDGAAAWDKNTFALAIEVAPSIQFWRWNGEQLEQVGTSIPAPFAVRDVVVSDLDGDGKQDLILGPYDNPAIAIMWGLGDFRFTPPQLLQGKGTGSHPRIVDWNLDGKPDIVVSEWNSGAVRLHMNKGGRQFESQEITPTTKQEVPRIVAVGDIDMDGRPDLLVSLETSPFARIVYNRPTGPEFEEIPLPAGSVGAAIMKDGTLILSEENKAFLVKRNDFIWEYRTLPVGSLPSPIIAKDINGDGFDDFVSFNSAGGGITVHMGPLWNSALPSSVK